MNCIVSWLRRAGGNGPHQRLQQEKVAGVARQREISARRIQRLVKAAAAEIFSEGKARRGGRPGLSAALDRGVIPGARSSLGFVYTGWDRNTGLESVSRGGPRAAICSASDSRERLCGAIPARGVFSISVSARAADRAGVTTTERPNGPRVALRGTRGDPPTSAEASELGRSTTTRTALGDSRWRGKNLSFAGSRK